MGGSNGQPNQGEGQSGESGKVVDMKAFKVARQNREKTRQPSSKDPVANRLHNIRAQFEACDPTARAAKHEKQKAELPVFDAELVTPDVQTVELKETSEEMALVKELVTWSLEHNASRLVAVFLKFQDQFKNFSAQLAQLAQFTKLTKGNAVKPQTAELATSYLFDVRDAYAQNLNPENPPLFENVARILLGIFPNFTWKAHLNDQCVVEIINLMRNPEVEPAEITEAVLMLANAA